MQAAIKVIVYLALGITPVMAGAQHKAIADAAKYPQDYFRNPLDIPILLAGNFGECRPGHFHSGVDIKTLGTENKPVHAAADGYVSRIKMDKGGFGHALYVTHPNGYTTLYAHLNDFAPAMQKYLRQEQYAKKRWDIDVQLPGTLFPVKKGQLIAYSGNTGASTAPHLHFEIRNTKTEHPLNPQLFGLPITDKVAPVPVEVYFYSGNIYGGSPTLNVPVVKRGGEYKPAKTDNGPYYSVRNDTVAIPAGMTGIGVNVDDYMDGSDNTIGLLTARLYMDDSLQAEVKLDDIGYDETRYINAYIDYGARHRNHKWVQLLFQQPGNKLGQVFGYLNNDKGRLSLMGGTVRKITLVIADDMDNESRINFFVDPVMRKSTVRNEDDGCTPFYVNKTNGFATEGVAFSLDDKQLYDDICFRFIEQTQTSGHPYSMKYQLHHPYVPVHHYFDLKIKSGKDVPEALKNKVVMLYSDGKDEDGRAAVVADSGWYKAAVRNFGTYWLTVDTIPPVITPMQRNNSNLGKAKQIAFSVKDNMTSVRSFSGYLDEQWICFEQHGGDFFYKFDEHCGKGKHKLVFKAEDENGNVRVSTLSFVR